jgi:hypothetical protein
MTQYTDAQLDRRLTEIDSLLFLAATGQMKITWEQFVFLKDDAETMMNLYAYVLSESGRGTYEGIRAERRKKRELGLIAASIKRHAELHPEENILDDKIIARAFDETKSEKSRKEAFQEFLMIFNYLFENSPSPPVEPKKWSFWNNLFGGD